MKPMSLVEAAMLRREREQREAMRNTRTSFRCSTPGCKVPLSPDCLSDKCQRCRREEGLRSVKSRRNPTKETA